MYPSHFPSHLFLLYLLSWHSLHHQQLTYHIFCTNTNSTTLFIVIRSIAMKCEFLFVECLLHDSDNTPHNVWKHTQALDSTKLLGYIHSTKVINLALSVLWGPCTVSCTNIIYRCVNIYNILFEVCELISLLLS